MKMATVSFDKDIIIKNEKSLNILVEGLNKNEKISKDNDKKIILEMNRGEKLLKQISSHLKNL
jgi:hypothetical protein